MNRTRALVLAVVGLVLLIGLVCVFKSKKSHERRGLNQQDASPLYLKITRVSVENSNPVVFVKIKGPNDRRIVLSWVLAIEQPHGNTTMIPVTLNAPIGSVAKSRDEFGVLVPTNFPCWKLRVSLMREEAGLYWRLKQMAEKWGWFKRNGKSSIDAARSVVNAFYGADVYVLESNPITNSVAFAEQVTRSTTVEK